MIHSGVYVGVVDCLFHQWKNFHLNFGVSIYIHSSFFLLGILGFLFHAPLIYYTSFIEDPNVFIFSFQKLGVKDEMGGKIQINSNLIPLLGKVSILGLVYSQEYIFWTARLKYF